MLSLQLLLTGFGFGVYIPQLIIMHELVDQLCKLEQGCVGCTFSSSTYVEPIRRIQELRINDNVRGKSIFSIFKNISIFLLES